MKDLRPISVKTFDGKIIQCRLMRTTEKTAIVCSESEWLQSKKEEREPMMVGFPLESTSLVLDIF